MVSDERFFAWLDGELEPSEAARIEAAVAADARLSALAEEHRNMQSSLSRAFATLLEAPLPEALVAAVRTPTAEVVDLAEARNRRQVRRWPSIAQWGSIAATLALGIAVGTMIPHQHDSAPVAVQDGKLYAVASLGSALDTQLASAPAGDVRIGMTFRDHRGAICRTFTGAASSGLACRDSGRWQVRGLFAPPAGQSTEYRTAAGMDPALASLVDSTMASEPFDAAEERAAKQRRWR